MPEEAIRPAASADGRRPRDAKDAPLDTSNPLADLPEDRESKILLELARAGEGRVAFAGLRRKLGMHQEILSRTLRRLSHEGLVNREVGGYRLTEEGYRALQGQALAVRPTETLTVVQMLLPPTLSSEAAAGALDRRWFRGLRWYGKSEAPGETTLSWIVDGTSAPSFVRTRILGSALSVEVESAADPGDAFGHLGPILGAVAELYSAAARPPHDVELA